MEIERVLARVEDDLRAGHTFIAIQRLTTLVQGDPANLTLRRRLAHVHLAVGNWVEAGRWSYLDEDRDAHAVAAFERAFRHPAARLAALRWPSPPRAADPTARHVLTALTEEVVNLPRRQRHGTVLTTDERSSGDVAGSVAGVAFVAVNLAIYVAGLVALVRWVF
jgi:hypothetical protein